MKGQAGVEFMILISIMLIIVLIFVWNGLSTQQRVFDVKTDVEAQQLCDNIAFEINSAVKAGDGYKRNFYVKNDFFGVSNFTISVSEYSVFIDWYHNSVSSSIITKNIHGIIEREKKYTIENKDGEIYATQIL
jgi:hypothetical protein